MIIWFWKDVSKWVGDLYRAIRSGSGGTDPDTL